MISIRRFVGCLFGSAVLALGALMATSGVAAASPPATCSGTPSSPGTLAGNYPSGVRIEGACEVNGGHAEVHGTLTLASGADLIAAFALNDVGGSGTSSLTVLGNVRVESGASLLLGCDPGHFACIDDPSQEHPTLTSADYISGNLTETAPLGVVLHNTAIGGNVTETGGGGGFTCDPSGVFALFGSPVYSDYEVGSIGGNLRISGLTSCWLGVVSIRIHGSAHFAHNQLKDRDAIEILDNHVGGNLECRDNSMVWDSGETGPGLYPRAPSPNTVAGKRLGQCVLASPATDDSAPGPGAF